MERIPSVLFPMPISNVNIFSAYIEHNRSTQSLEMLGVNITNSSCLPQGSIKVTGSVGYQTPKVQYSGGHGSEVRKNGVATRKSMHKYVERKRRQDMKALYSLLRSLLPDEYVSGRRSTAEDLSETSKYIKDLQKKVKELTQQRDEKRKEHPCETLPSFASSETFPAVHIHSVGSGVLVSANALKCQITNSDLLATVQNSGLHIISASCIAVNDKLFHSIHAKVSDVDSFESRNLYRKLWKLVGKNSSDAEEVEC